jgi:hypothetical protein
VFSSDDKHTSSHDHTTSAAGPASTLSSSIGRDDFSKVQTDTRAPAPSSSDNHSHTGSSNIPNLPIHEHEHKDKSHDDDSSKPSIADHHSEVVDKKRAIKDEGNDDIKLVGPGPRPLEQVAREHGGNAGAASSAPGGVALASDNNTADQARRDSGKGLGMGSVDERKHSAGSGEHVVKASGLAADGGDFDASKPGAGREADRKFYPIHYSLTMLRMEQEVCTNDNC